MIPHKKRLGFLPAAQYLKVGYSYIEIEDSTWVGQIIRGIEYIKAVRYPDTIGRQGKNKYSFYLNDEYWPDMTGSIDQSCIQIWAEDGYKPEEPICIKEPSDRDSAVEALARTIVIHGVDFSIECPLSMIAADYLDVKCFIREFVQAAVNYAKDNWDDDSAGYQYYGYGYYYGIDMEKDLLKVDYTFVDQNNIVYDEYYYDGPAVMATPDWKAFAGNAVLLTEQEKNIYDRFADNYFGLYDVFPVAMIGKTDAQGEDRENQYIFLMYDKRDFALNRWEIAVLQDNPDTLIKLDELFSLTDDQSSEREENNGESGDKNWLFGIEANSYFN